MNVLILKMNKALIFKTKFFYENFLNQNGKRFINFNFF